MTTHERNARTLALLAPLACPLADVLCVIARLFMLVVNVERTMRVERRALSAQREFMTATQYNLLTPPVPTASVPTAPIVYDVATPVLGDDDVVKVAPATKRIRKPRKPSKLVVSKAANSVVTPNACRCVATTKQGTRCKRDVRKGHLCAQHQSYQPESMTLAAYVALLANNERHDERAQ